MTDETKPENFRNERGGDHSQIKGWGIDADPENDPIYPMRKRTNAEHKGYDWERPPQQVTDIEVLHSVERPNRTAVFGTSVPPRGLSGALRRYAFKYSENSYGHWLPLIMADRIDVIEGLLEDLKKGHFPNIYKEKGLSGQWKYNRKKFILKNLALVAVGVGAFIYFRGRGKD